MGVRPLLDGTFKCIFQVLLVCSVVDDRDAKTVVVTKVSFLFLAVAFGDTLDLLELLDLEDVGASSFAEQCDEHCVLAMCVDAAACAAQREGGHEQRRACRWFEHLDFPAYSVLMFLPYVLIVAYRRPAQVFSGRIVHDEQVLRLHELFLDARGGNIDAFAIAD